VTQLEVNAQPPGGPLEVRLFARTDVGQIREHNEDNFLVADLSNRCRGLLEVSRTTTLAHQGMLFAVCDGMGGAAAGEVASQMAVDILFEKMSESASVEPPPDRNEVARRLVRSVEIAGARIFQEAKSDRSRRGMGTTVTAAALVDNHLFLAQVGDSRGYLLRAGKLTQVTRDQSLVNQLIEAGQLTEEEAETFEHNNIILQALGTADTVQVDLTYVELRRGDLLMMCSDGLSGMMRNDDIRELLLSSTEPEEMCKALIDRANQAGGHDNITVIVAHFDGEALTATTAEDELKYRKYTLPTDPSSNNRVHSIAPPAKSSGNDAPASAKGAPSAPPPPMMYDPADDAIDLPGTHIPGWQVAALVLGVLLFLAGAGWAFLR
jgi:serine/threonine protein phosphatase PrpC